MEDSRIENQKHRIEVAKRDLEVAKRNRDEAKRIGNYQKSFKAYRSGTKEGTVWDSNVWVAQRHLEEERKHLSQLTRERTEYNTRQLKSAGVKDADVKKYLKTDGHVTEEGKRLLREKGKSYK